MKNKIIITQGISASGKTYWATNFVKSNPEYVNINRDDIRGELFCDGKLNWSIYKSTKVKEAKVTEMQDQLISEAVLAGKSIIISDTNLNLKTLERFKNLPCLAEYQLEYKVFKVDLLEALQRDAQRINGVGYKVITKQYKTFCDMFYSDNYHKFSASKDDAFICDLDGTICDMKGIRTPFEWDKVGEDKPRVEIISMVRGLLTEGLHPIFVSGRDACCMKQTQSWLDHYFPELEGHYKLFMRPEGDMRKDTIIKEEIFTKYIGHNYNVRVVLDDRPTVSRMFMYKLGLNVVNVGNPWLEF